MTPTDPTDELTRLRRRVEELPAIVTRGTLQAGIAYAMQSGSRGR
jgi:hypothetical protein